MEAWTSLKLLLDLLLEAQTPLQLLLDLLVEHQTPSQLPQHLPLEVQTLPLRVHLEWQKHLDIHVHV